MGNERDSHKNSVELQANHSTTGGPAGIKQDVILVIDDDHEFLDSIRRMLRREGWVVHTAASPIDGLTLYEAYWPEIKLVLLDYFMPILRGDEVFERLQHINPDVRVILTTACEDDVSEKLLKSGLWGFVQKPPSPCDLIRQVRIALNHHDQPPPRRVKAGRKVRRGILAIQKCGILMEQTDVSQHETMDRDLSAGVGGGHRPAADSS